MGYKQLSKPEKWIIKGIPVLFLVGSMMHYVYELSGNIPIVGAVAPVNESIWEHLKLAILPMILWYCLYYAVYGRKYKINKDNWFFANLVSLTVYMIFIIAFYYTCTGAFGCKSLFMDILDFLLALMAGQFAALKIYNWGSPVISYISLGLAVLLVIIFVVFTFYPPHLPLFMDYNTMKYGI